MPGDLAYRDVGSLEGVRPGDTLIYDLEVLSLEQRSGDLVVGSSSEIPAANSGAAPQQSN